MSSYISSADIDNVFGSVNVTKWSNLDNATTTRDAGRVISAIAYGEGFVEDRFRGGEYSVPFQRTTGSWPVMLVDWMAKLAGIWLYRSRGSLDGDKDKGADKYDDMSEKVEEQIDAYVSGQRRLSLQLAESDTPSAPTVGR